MDVDVDGGANDSADVKFFLGILSQESQAVVIKRGREDECTKGRFIIIYILYYRHMAIFDRNCCYYFSDLLKKK